MPSIKDLKKRIGTVRNTQQTTRAMKMVSAAKLRRAQEAIVSHRPYAQGLGKVLNRIVAFRAVELGVSSSELLPQLLSRTETASTTSDTKKKVLACVFSSDRGLCGGFNASVVKVAMQWGKEFSGKGMSVRYFGVGKKATEVLKTRMQGIVEREAIQGRDFGNKVTFKDAAEVADRLITLYQSGEVDEVVLIYSEFKNAISQQVLVEKWLPWSEGESLGEVAGDITEETSGDMANLLIKPGTEELLEKLLVKSLRVQVYRAMLESQASEHGARMTAMENATKNAGDMIRKLSLLYNKQRQAGITKELLEITAGAESQKAAD